MIPLRRRCWVDSMIPENWGRSRADYAHASGRAAKVASNPAHPSAKRQAERFKRRREEDERKKRALLKGLDL